MKSFFNTTKDNKTIGPKVSTPKTTSLIDNPSQSNQKIEIKPIPNQFKVTKLPSDNQAYDNVVLISPTYQTSKEKYVAKLAYPNSNESSYYPLAFDEKINGDTIAISSLVRSELSYTLNSEQDIQLIPLEDNKSHFVNQISIEIQNIRPPCKDHKKMKAEDLTKMFISHFQNYPLIPGQILLMPYDDGEYNGGLQIKVLGKKYDENNQSMPSSPFTQAYLNEKTQIDFSLSPFSKNITLSTTSANVLPKMFSLDFKEKGIGGHKKQLEQIVRDGFLSRAMPTNYAEAYGEKHNTKGILLYGPPGTGKTLIARVIGGFFTKEKVKVVNGPELKNKYVGQSQENLRNVFREAEKEWKEKGLDSDLHVIIFDEIDAVCPRRGSRSGSAGVEDDMVAQMLTILDGVDSPKNIIVIGTTNRKDLVDPALLRQGRLGIVTEIGLPDEIARYEILTIHTNELVKHALLDNSVNLNFWAKETKNFTGAEIEQLVTKACHYAMANNFDLSSGKTELVLKENIKSEKQLEKVTQEHFMRAFSEITPAFGVDKKYNKFKKENFVVYDETIETMISDFTLSLSTLRKNKNMNRLQMLICGESGVGKTNLAMHLAQLSGAKYIKILTPDMLLSLPLEKQLILIEEEFDNAERAEFSVIILDELESLLGANAELNGYSNILRLKYEAMLKNITESENKCIVIATATDENFIKKMKLYNLFNEFREMDSVHLLKLSSKECCEVLTRICDSLGYKVIPSSQVSNDKREITLPIRDLVYQIKKFCSYEKNNNTLDIDAFYKFVQLSQKNVSGLLNNEKDKLNISDNKTVLFHHNAKQQQQNQQQHSTENLQFN